MSLPLFAIESCAFNSSMQQIPQDFTLAIAPPEASKDNDMSQRTDNDSTWPGEFENLEIMATAQSQLDHIQGCDNVSIHVGDTIARNDMHGPTGDISCIGNCWHLLDHSSCSRTFRRNGAVFTSSQLCRTSQQILNSVRGIASASYLT